MWPQGKRAKKALNTLVSAKKAEVKRGEDVDQWAEYWTQATSVEEQASRFSGRYSTKDPTLQKMPGVITVDVAPDDITMAEWQKKRIKRIMENELHPGDRMIMMERDIEKLTKLVNELIAIAAATDSRVQGLVDSTAILAEDVRVQVDGLHEEVRDLWQELDGDDNRSSER